MTSSTVHDEGISVGRIEGVHLGGFVCARASSDYGMIDIRQFFVPIGSNKEIPTKKGITLRRFEWETLKEKIEEIKQFSPELQTAVPCSDSLDHSNLQAFLACPECNPSGDTVF